MPFCTKQTHIFLHWGKQHCQQQHNLPLIIFFSVSYLIFVFELFIPGQLQWLFPPMEVIKLQHPTTSSLWRSDDGLISEKSKAEVYLGNMESKHTTRFTRKKACKKNKPLCLHFDRFWHWKPCYYYIYWTLFSAHNSIAYVIFILTQRLVPVYQDCICYLIISIHINVVAHSLIKIILFSLTFTHVMQNQILSIFSLIER